MSTLCNSLKTPYDTIHVKKRNVDQISTADVNLYLFSYCIRIMNTVSNSIETTFDHTDKSILCCVNFNKLFSDINLNYLAMWTIACDSSFIRASIVSECSTIVSIEYNFFVSIEHEILFIFCVEILILDFNTGFQYWILILDFNTATIKNDKIKLKLCVFVVLLFVYCVTTLIDSKLSARQRFIESQMRQQWAISCCSSIETDLKGKAIKIMRIDSELAQQCIDLHTLFVFCK